MRFKPLHDGEQFTGLRLHSPTNATERRLLKALEDVLRRGGRIEITPNDGECSITESFQVRGREKVEPPLIIEASEDDFKLPYLEEEGEN